MRIDKNPTIQKKKKMFTAWRKGFALAVYLIQFGMLRHKCEPEILLFGSLLGFFGLYYCLHETGPFTWFPHCCLSIGP